MGWRSAVYCSSLSGVPSERAAREDCAKAAHARDGLEERTKTCSLNSRYTEQSLGPAIVTRVGKYSFRWVGGPIGCGPTMPLLRSWISHPMEHESGSVLRRVGIPIVAQSLGEALNEASRILKVSFEPHEPPKWFRVFGIPDLGDGYMLVDVHIKRGESEICPKQDLAFPIFDSDIVCVWTLIC